MGNLKWGLLGFFTVEGWPEGAVSLHAGPSSGSMWNQWSGVGHLFYFLLLRDEPSTTSLPAASQNNSHLVLVRPHCVISQSEKRAEPIQRGTGSPKASRASRNTWESMTKSQTSPAGLNGGLTCGWAAERCSPHPVFAVPVRAKAF